MRPPAKKKNKSKKKKQGNQGESASHPAPWAEEAKEAGAAAADVGVEAKSWPPPLQADVVKAFGIMLSAAPAAAAGEAIFMAKFNLSPSDDEEEMREAGAREACEETRGVGGVLARNNIAAVPKANKGSPRMKGAQEACGAAGGRQGEYIL
jgi:hypothetical protein